VQAPEPIRESFELAGAPGKARANILGDVRYDLPVEANRWVEMELDFLVNQRREVIGQWLSRADKYRDFVQEIFASYGIPRDLHHLAMVESGYSPTARSHAGAVGMWQFMSTTGRGMGLRIDDVVDERMDPVRSTHAAARHLRDLHRDFRGDWALAAAAYNAGSGRINRGLGRYNVTNFWDLAERGDLAQETRHYVPRLYAVTIIGRDPARFGYPAPANVLPRFRPDSVRVDIETPVAELAKIANLNASELATLNPHLVRGTAPAGYKVWTPAGSGPAIQIAFDTSAYRRSGGYAWYTLRPGENVAQVAAAGAIPVERIRELNLSAALDRMGTGDRVRLPAPAVRTLNARPVERQRLASASDEPRGPSSPELDAARAEARRLRAARREEERAREAQREQEREAARIAERARAARRAEEREAARAEERAASARRLAARAEADKDDEDTPRRRASERDSAESKVAATDEARPRRSSDSSAARRTSDGERVASRSASSDDERPTARRTIDGERVASRSASSDDERPSASRPRRTERADSSARPRRASDGEERPRTHTVERGETLRGLAEKYNVTVAQLRAANDIAAGKGVELGMRLRLPRAASSSASLAAASERAARTRSSDDDRPSTASRSSTSVRTGTSERRTTRSDSTRRASSDEDAPRSRTASERRASTDDTPRARTTSERRASSDDEAPRTRTNAERRDSSAARRTTTASRDSAAKTRSTSTRRDSSATRRTALASHDSSASRTRTSRDSSASRSRGAANRDSAATRARGSSGETKPRTAERTEGSTRRASTSETPRPSQHTVKSGETLFGIAREYGVTVPALREANDMDAGAALQPGQKLRIPRS
jgi:LysM repeat protein